MWKLILHLLRLHLHQQPSWQQPFGSFSSLYQGAHHQMDCLKHQSLQAALKEVLHSESKDIIKFVLALIQQAVSVHTPQECITLKDPAWVLLIKGMIARMEQFSPKSSCSGESSRISESELKKGISGIDEMALLGRAAADTSGALVSITILQTKKISGMEQHPLIPNSMGEVDLQLELEVVAEQDIPWKAKGKEEVKLATTERCQPEVELSNETAILLPKKLHKLIPNLQQDSLLYCSVGHFGSHVRLGLKVVSLVFFVCPASS
nr:Os03g0379650 [Ipomoea batatas]